MRTALKVREDKLGFQLRKRNSRIVPPITDTDMDFADDIALVIEGIKEAYTLLSTIYYLLSLYYLSTIYR